MSELLAAFLGAIAAGTFQFLAAWRERRRQTEAMLTAIVCEVGSICRLIRHQHYLEFFEQTRGEIAAGTWDGRALMIDIRSNYFSVFESLAPQIGQLKPEQVAKIVNFYAYCKSVIDSTRPDGPAAEREYDAFVMAGVFSVEALLRAILTLGDDIAQFPALPIAEREPPELGDMFEKAGVSG